MGKHLRVLFWGVHCWGRCCLFRLFLHLVFPCNSMLPDIFRSIPRCRLLSFSSVGFCLFFSFLSFITVTCLRFFLVVPEPPLLSLLIFYFFVLFLFPLWVFAQKILFLFLFFGYPATNRGTCTASPTRRESSSISTIINGIWMTLLTIIRQSKIKYAYLCSALVIHLLAWLAINVIGNQPKRARDCFLKCESNNNSWGASTLGTGSLQGHTLFSTLFLVTQSTAIEKCSCCRSRVSGRGCWRNHPSIEIRSLFDSLFI